MALFLEAFSRDLLRHEIKERVSKLFTDEEMEQYLPEEIAQEYLKNIKANQPFYVYGEYFGGKTAHVFANTLSPDGAVCLVVAELACEERQWKIISLADAQDSNFLHSLKKHEYPAEVRKGIDYYVSNFYAGHLLKSKGSISTPVYTVRVYGSEEIVSAFCSDAQRAFLHKLDTGTKIDISYSIYVHSGHTRYT